MKTVSSDSKLTPKFTQRPYFHAEIDRRCIRFHSNAPDGLRIFYRWSEYRSCQGTSRWMQASYAIKPPRSGEREKKGSADSSVFLSSMQLPVTQQWLLTKPYVCVSSVSLTIGLILSQMPRGWLQSSGELTILHSVQSVRVFLCSVRFWEQTTITSLDSVFTARYELNV
jgi:hypothetical protein